MLKEQLLLYKWIVLKNVFCIEIKVKSCFPFHCSEAANG